MVWYAWVMIVMAALSIWATINAIGERRQPITRRQAAWVVFVQLLYVWAIVALASH